MTSRPVAQEGHCFLVVCVNICIDGRKAGGLPHRYNNLAKLDNTENIMGSQPGPSDIWRLRRTGDLAEVDLGKFYCTYSHVTAFA